MKTPDEVELEKKQRHIAERLAVPLWRWRHAVWDGELRKHLRRISDRLDAAIAAEATRQKLGTLADFDANKLDLDSAISLSTRLDEVLFESGDPEYVCSALEAEFQRGDTTPVTWRKLYGEHLPQALEKFRKGEEVQNSALTSVRNRLKALSHTRYEDYLLLRTRQ